MNRKEFKDYIDALIDEYEADHEEEFEHEDYFDDDYYPEKIKDILDDIPPVFKPSDVQSYCSPELLQLIVDTGPNWKDSFIDCSIRVYGCDDKCDEILLAHNDAVDINEISGTKINIKISGIAKVFELMSNTNHDLYFNGTMGHFSCHPICMSNIYLEKESTLMMHTFNFKNE